MFAGKHFLFVSVESVNNSWSSGGHLTLETFRDSSGPPCAESQGLTDGLCVSGFSHLERNIGNSA